MEKINVMNITVTTELWVVRDLVFFVPYGQDIASFRKVQSHYIYGILSDTTIAFTDQHRLCCRKHRSLQHQPCFRATMNLQPCTRRPRCYSSRATGTPVASTADSKRHALFFALVWPFRELLRSPFPFLLDFHLRETFFRNYNTVLFWTTSTRFDFQKTCIATFTFSVAVYFVRFLQSTPDMVCYGNALYYDFM